VQANSNSTQPAADIFTALSMKLSDMGFSNRTTNCFRNENIIYVGDIVKYQEFELLKIPNFGRKSLHEVRDRLKVYGLRCGMEINPQYADYANNQVPYTPPERIPGIDPEKNIHLLREIKDLGLSVRTAGALKSVRNDRGHPTLSDGNIGDGIKYVGDLVSKSAASLLTVPNFGRKSLRELDAVLASMNLSLAKEVEEWTGERVAALREKYKAELEKLNRHDATSLFESIAGEHRTVESEIDGLVQSLNLTDNHKAIFVTYYGLDGTGRKTLETVGQMCGKVTRERIRQILVKCNKRLKLNESELQKIPEVMAFIESRLPSTKEAIEELLVSEGWVTKYYDITGLLSLYELMHLTSSWEIINSRGKNLIFPQGEYPAFQRMLILCRKLSSCNGYCTVEDMNAILSEYPDTSITKLMRILESHPEVYWLSKEEGCFYITTGENRLVNTIKRILTASDGNQIDVTNLRSALRRNYRLQKIPTKEVLLAFCNHSPSFGVLGDMIASKVPLDPGVILGQTDLTLMHMLRNRGNVATYYELKHDCLNAGMNENTFETFLGLSPIVMLLQKGIYALRGAYIEQGLIESKQRALASSNDTQAQVSDNGWIGVSKIWVAMNVTNGAIRTGITSIPKSIKQFIASEYPLYSITGEDFGILKINDLGQLWSVKKALANKGADTDDILLLVFDLDANTATIEVGDSEAIEYAKTLIEHKIDLDAVEDEDRFASEEHLEPDNSNAQLNTVE